MATKKLEVHPEALAEMRAAREWYVRQSAKAALRFMDELDRGIEEIAANPDRWPEHRHGTKSYRMHRFPYLIIYRIDVERIEIIACQHAHRRPAYWREGLA